MDKRVCLKDGRTAQGLFKTLFLFLSHHKFIKTADMLREEWGYDQVDLEKFPSTSLVLIRCECSRNQAPQTETQNTARCSQKSDRLEGPFEGEIIRNDALIFYVCEHSHKKDNQAERSCARDHQSAPRYEAKELKWKFSQLQNEHHKLIEITSELTTALQINIISQTKNINSVLEQCKTIYPSLFHANRSLISSPESRVQSRSPLYINKSDNKNDSKPQNATCDVHEDAGYERKVEGLHVDAKELGSTMRSLTRTPGTPENQPQLETQPGDGFTLNLGKLRENSPLNAPLTPETVRCALESVFERIFETEKAKEQAAKDFKGQPLTRSDVERIVGDVLNEAINSPSICGTGEMEFSRRESPTPRKLNADIRKELNFLHQSCLHGGNTPRQHPDEDDDKKEVDLLEADLHQDDLIAQFSSGEALLPDYLACEKPHTSLPSYGLKRGPLPSTSLFPEESKRFQILETANSKRFMLGSQNAMKSKVGTKTFSQYSGGYNRYPVTPLCYMENCQKLKNGNNAQCSCSKCRPGQSRYSCGCYDAIRKDIAENGDNLVDATCGNGESKLSSFSRPSHNKPGDNATTNTDHQFVAKESHIESERLDSINNHGGSIITNKEGGRAGSGCKVCGEKRCECAFDPRPKLCRTPTL